LENKKERDKKGALFSGSLFCERSGKYFPEEIAKCPLPKDYCKFRTACIINLRNKLN